MENLTRKKIPPCKENHCPRMQNKTVVRLKCFAQAPYIILSRNVWMNLKVLLKSGAYWRGKAYFMWKPLVIHLLLECYTENRSMLCLCLNRCSSMTLNISRKSPFEASRAVFWSLMLWKVSPAKVEWVRTPPHPKNTQPPPGVVRRSQV